MKKLFIVPAISMLLAPAFAHSMKTTTRTYDTEVSSPAMDADMIEAEEEGYEDSEMDMDLEEQRMEDRYGQTKTESSDSIDYNDRTRTNRERKAINTSSDASDDQ